MAVGEDLFWAKKSYTIREVATQEQLPIMVKVSEGIYSDCESETFSQGDLLNINNVIDIPKVVACFTGRTAVREDEEGYIQQEQILIPLRYRGNLKVVSPYTGKSGLTSVRELCNHFPRYIKNLRKIKDDNGELINAGETLELDRIIPDKGLVLGSKGRYFVLNEKRREEVLYLPDPTEYTLDEVVNRFPLPMFVNFLDNEFPRMITRDLQEALANVKSYEGANLKLLNVVHQKVIVGHHKSAELAIYDTQSKREQSCQRTVIILPWDSEAASEIEVFIPRDGDDSTYETISAMNFSRRGLIEENIDGTLYLDMVKSPKVYVYEEYENQKGQGRKRRNPPPLPISIDNKEKPPPRPERVKTPSNKTPNREGPPVIPRKPRISSTRTSTTESIYDEAVPDPPNLPPRPSARVQDSDIYEVGPDSSSSSPMKEQSSSMAHITDDEKERGYVTVPTKESVIAKVPEKVRKSIKKLQNDLLDFFSKKSATNRQELLDLHEQAQKDINSTGHKDMGYAKIDDRNITSQKSGIRSKRETIPNQYSRTPSTSKLEDCDDHDYDYPDISALKKKTLQRKSAGQNTQTDFQKQFETLSSIDLCQLLSKCHMETLARVCYQETLDGSFFTNISDDELKDTFSFNNIQLKKFKKIRDEGWLPK